MRRSRLFRYLMFVVLLVVGAGAGAAPDPQRQKELNHLLEHDCGSCHGMRLEGGLGPSLKPERLRHYSVEQLVVTILHGRPGTPMPPWRPFLSEQDARWLAVLLKEGGSL